MEVLFDNFAGMSITEGTWEGKKEYTRSKNTINKR